MDMPSLSFMTIEGKDFALPLDGSYSNSSKAWSISDFSMVPRNDKSLYNHNCTL